MKIYTAIILAGGASSRLGLATPKPFLDLAGKVVARHSFDLLASHPQIASLVVVCAPENEKYFTSEKPLFFARAGKERTDSVANGLTFARDAYVCIHDAARPFLSRQALDRLLNTPHEASALAAPVVDTIKQLKNDKLTTLDRSQLYAMQTPQVAPRAWLEDAYARISRDGLTDDMHLLERAGYLTSVTVNLESNFKITRPEDWALAQILAEASCATVS